MDSTTINRTSPSADTTSKPNAKSPLLGCFGNCTATHVEGTTKTQPLTQSLASPRVTLFHEDFRAWRSLGVYGALLIALSLVVAAWAPTADAAGQISVPPEVFNRIERSPTCCKITQIAVATVTARDPATGVTVEFERPQSLLNIDQQVWLSQSPGPGDTRVSKQVAVGIQFPFDKTRRQKVGDQYWMETTIRVSFTPGLNVGRVDGATRTWTTASHKGFHGAVMYVFQDRVGNNLPFFPTMRTYGVNGRAIPGAQSDRRDVWSDAVPLEIVNKIYKVAIVHLHHPQPTVGDFLRYAREAGEAAQTWTKVITAIGGAAGGGGTRPGGSGPTIPSPTTPPVR